MGLTLGAEVLSPAATDHLSLNSGTLPVQTLPGDSQQDLFYKHDSFEE